MNNSKTSAPKVEMSAENVLAEMIGLDKIKVKDDNGIWYSRWSTLKAMEQYATLKTQSANNLIKKLDGDLVMKQVELSEKDKEIERLKEIIKEALLLSDVPKSFAKIENILNNGLNPNIDNRPSMNFDPY